MSEILANERWRGREEESSDNFGRKLYPSMIEVFCGRSESKDIHWRGNKKFLSYHSNTNLKRVKTGKPSYFFLL